MRLRTIITTSGAILALGAGVALAAPPQDPAVGGQHNSHWGCVASNLARIEVEEGTGGAFGQHSRSTRATENVGGFANEDNGFGITFNVREEGETNNGRAGVGNFTLSQFGVHPGDGGQGVHADGNADASLILNPYTGEFGDPEEIHCTR